MEMKSEREKKKAWREKEGKVDTAVDEIVRVDFIDLVVVVEVVVLNDWMQTNCGLLTQMSSNGAVEQDEPVKLAQTPARLTLKWRANKKLSQLHTSA